MSSVSVRSLHRRGLGAALAVSVAIATAGCAARLSDGEQRALDYTERIAIGMADDATRSRTIIGIPPETLAAEMVASYRSPSGAGIRPDSFTVETLDWGGATSWTEPAFVVMRITADVDEGEEQIGGGLFGSRREYFPAGRATECYWITLPVTGGEIGADVDRRACPDNAEPRIPLSADSSRLPDDALERIVHVLSNDSWRAEAATAFDPSITVDARMIDGLRVIAARGARPEDCVIAARRPSGEVERVTLSREQMMPGEIGCSADAARLLGAAIGG